MANDKSFGDKSFGDKSFVIAFLSRASIDYDTKKLQSFVTEKSFAISEKGALAGRISPGIVKSLVSLTDKPK
uniref:Uncharacterized protein n=1 Tax=Oryza brachyantha TaxID=4533 RepID=J3MER5_ORYBR